MLSAFSHCSAPSLDKKTRLSLYGLWLILEPFNKNILSRLLD